MRLKPHAFLRLEDRWINLAMVTDIEDHGDELRLFMATDMARMAGQEQPEAIDVARRVVVRDPEAIERLKRWLLLNDED